jgi:uncharacterized protein (DUF4415 family)
MSQEYIAACGSMGVSEHAAFANSGGARRMINRALPTEGGYQAMPETVKTNRKGRPPYVRPVKQMVSLRMDIDVLEGLRATGKGWQTRVNAAMREWLQSQTPTPS